MRRAGATAVYRRLLRVLPASFRAEAEDDMVAVFAAAHARARRHGGWRYAAFWIVTCLDLAITTAAERRRRDRSASVMLRQSFSGWIHDLRFSARRLAKRPAWTALSAGTLALGLAAATVATILVRDVLLQPLPFPRSDRLVRIVERSDNGRGWWPSFPNAADWRAQAACFSGVGIADIPAVRPVTLNGTAVRVPISRAARGLFETLGVRPVAGRLFTAEENAPGGAHVAIVSEAFWRGPLGGRPLDQLAVGLRDTPYLVVGVLPAAFRFLGDGAAWTAPADVWTPMDQDHDLGGRTAHGYHVVGRLRDGVTLAQARTEMSALSRRLKVEHAEPTQADTAVLTPLQDLVVRQARDPLRWLLYASLAVLLVACVNLAAAILAQGLQRIRDLSIRVALGASRGRLVAHVLADAMGLAVPAVLAGLTLAAIALTAIRAIAGASLPRLDETRVDLTIVAMAAAAALVTALLAGAIPALVLASRPFLGRLRTHGAGAAGPRRLWPAFIAIQVAISMLLLAGTGLLVRSFVAAVTVDLGYDARNVLAVDVTLPDGAYRDDARRVAFYDAALARVRAAPGIAAAGLTSVLPHETSAFTGGTSRDVPGSASVFAGYRLVDSGYFEALGIPRMQMDRAAFEAGGAVVDRRLQQALWSGGDPIGDRVRSNFSRGVLTAVGLVGTVKEWDQDSETIGAVYEDYHRRPDAIGSMHFVVRYAGGAAAAVDGVRRAVAGVDPLVPVTIEPLQERATASLAGRRFLVALAGAFGAVALVLASVGVYALVAFAVAQGARESAIRIALGARPASVRGRAILSGVGPALAGVAGGLLGALWLGGALQAQLFHVRPRDPAVLATAALGACLAAWVAAALPARRAARVDPVAVLRME